LALLFNPATTVPLRMKEITPVHVALLFNPATTVPLRILHAVHSSRRIILSRRGKCRSGSRQA
jgi:hypothetical protein